MGKNDELYEKALEAIQELFSDTSVSAEDTKIALNTLVSEIDIMVESLGLD